MAFTLRQLQYFLAVAENGSISGAAHHLAISQSTITEAMKELEQDLGVTLFERQARGMTITHKGQQFLRHATKVLADVADARRALAAEPAPLSGRLQLGVTSLVAGYVLSDLLARFRRAYPAVSVAAVEDGADYLEHLLVNGELDVAVQVLQAEPADSALKTETLESSDYRLWLPIGHALAESPAVALVEIAEEPLIALAIDDVEATVRGIWRKLRLRPRIAFRTRSVEAVRSLVATGAGVALLPDLVYRPWSLEGDRIEARSIVEPLPTVEVGIAWRHGSPLSPAAQNFIAIARAHRPSRSR